MPVYHESTERSGFWKYKHCQVTVNSISKLFKCGHDAVIDREIRRPRICNRPKDGVPATTGSIDRNGNEDCEERDGATNESSGGLEDDIEALTKALKGLKLQ